jgi:hypothetical protein
MSSLRIQGQLDTQSTTSGWLQNQSKCSISLWFKTNVALSNSVSLAWSGSQVPFLCYSGSEAGGTIHSWMSGQGTALGNSTFTAPYTKTYWHHLVWSWDSTGSQKLYLDGTVIGSLSAGGLTANASHPLILGTPSGGTVDMQLAQVAVWHGYALTAGDVTNLLYASNTPANLATPATAYWTLQGTPGATPHPTTDAAFLDSIGGSVRFGAFAGTGTASYAADSPAYISPQTVSDARTGKSGQTVFLLPLVKTATVNTVPTFTVNGSPATLTQGPKDNAFWTFSLASPVQATDTLHITAPVGWATGAPALDMAVRNLRGQCEFPVAGTKTMGLGYNLGLKPLASDQNWCPVANWWRRLDPWDTSTVTATDAAGNPTQLAPGHTTVSAAFSTSQTPVGRYTLKYDSLDANATSVDLVYQSGPSGPVYHPELSSPTGTGGIGCVKVYDLPAGGARLQITHASRTPSLANGQILPPGNSPSTDPLAPEAVAFSYLDAGSGKGPSILRPMDSCANAGGQTWMAQGADLPSPTPASWTSPGATTTVAISQIRPLNTTVSPNVIDPGGTAIPWTATPTSILWGNNTYTVEAVCPSPHGLTTGQLVSINLNTPSVTVAYNGGTAIPITGSSNNLVFVTSPTTFVYIGVSSLLNGTRSNLSVAQSLSGATAAINPRGGSGGTTAGGVIFPPQFFAHLASQWDNTLLWVNIPVSATNSYIDALAVALAPFRCKLVLEYGNEDWNGGFNQWYVCFTLNQLIGPTGIVEGYQVRRSLEIAARFRSTFVASGRQSTDVLLSLMGQWGSLNGPLIDAAIAAYRAGHGAFDVLGGAPYEDMLISDSSLLGWTPAMALDLMRHYLVLDPTEIGWRADFAAAVNRYEAAIGKRVLRYCYEGDIESVATLVSSPYTQYVNAWDWQYHPDMADTEAVLYTQLQAAGVDVLTIYSFLFNGANSLGLSWGAYVNQEQGPGAGDGSDGKAVNTFAEAYVPGNVSVRGYAQRQWQQAYLSGSTVGALLVNQTLKAVTLTPVYAGGPFTIDPNRTQELATSGWLVNGPRAVTIAVPASGPFTIDPQRTQEFSTGA